MNVDARSTSPSDYSVTDSNENDPANPLSGQHHQVSSDSLSELESKLMLCEPALVRTSSRTDDGYTDCKTAPLTLHVLQTKPEFPGKKAIMTKAISKPLEDLEGFHFSAVSDFSHAILQKSSRGAMSEEKMTAITGVSDRLSMNEVNRVYAPLCEDLSRRVLEHFDDQDPKIRIPYVIGIAGPVASGKSTTSRVIQQILLQLLKTHFETPEVALVSTDNFLKPNQQLKDENLLTLKKGHPESFDSRGQIEFLEQIKDPNVAQITTPIYSHQAYDILPSQKLSVGRPHVLVLEGLNIFQPIRTPELCKNGEQFFSDYTDFGIYVNADHADIKAWYLDRAESFRQSGFEDEGTRWYQRDAEEVKESLSKIYDTVNATNLTQHIHGTRLRADLILEKGSDHALTGVQISKEKSFW